MLSRPVVAITGASSGIGAEFARQLAPEHDFILIARRKARLEELAARLKRQHQANAEILQADLAEEQELQSAAERIAAEKRLALLINNAGFGIRGRFWETPLAEQERMHRLHITATLRLTHAALRNMVARDSGGIINVAYMAAFVRGAGRVRSGGRRAASGSPQRRWWRPRSKGCDGANWLWCRAGDISL